MLNYLYFIIFFPSISATRLLKVTVFVYSDLMLVTREDEPGRCNVLQSPLFLRQLRLQDGMYAFTHLSANWETMVFLDVRDVIRNSRFSTFLKSPKKTWTKLELCKHTVPPNNLICYHVKPHWPFTFTFQYRIKGEIQQAQIAQLEINTQFYDYSGIFG